MLKPCPFCKGEFAFDFEAKNFRCGTCGATVPPDPYARTVNTRPIEDELTARIAELEALVQQLVWVGNDLLTDNTNPVTVTLFNGLAFRSKELLS